MEKANIPLKDVPFYAKGFGTTKNDTLDITMTDFEVGRLSVPGDILDQYQSELTSFGHSIIKNIPGFSVKEAGFEDGAAYFDGELPDVELFKK